MRLREVDVRFPDGVDRRRVVALGDTLSGVLADLGTVELVSLAVAGTDLATFAFAMAQAPGPVPLRSPTVGPTGTPANTAWPDVPAAEDCAEAVLAAADLAGFAPVEVVADRVADLPGADR